MDKPLISVIVPVYKVENYLKKCVDSIRNQTLSNIEIVLVDDGSPDNCPQMCDEYAAEDERINVVHKENGGISSSRNAGIDAAKADLITFVDSDDFIEEDALQILYELMENTGADAAVAAICDVYNNEIRKSETEGKTQVFSGREAVHEILKGKAIPGSPCAKLYKKALFDGYRFPLGLTYEDAYLLPEVFFRAEKVSVTDRKIYYYWHRNDSITTVKYSSRAKDIITAYTHVYKFVKASCPEYIEAAKFRVYWANFIVLDRLLKQPDYKNIDDYKKVYAFLKKHVKDIEKCQYFEKTRRISAHALELGMPFYKALWRLQEKRKGNCS